ncbi:hypothetical protein AKJ16_DCAP05696, partial [Drosera capensis]
SPRLEKEQEAKISSATGSFGGGGLGGIVIWGEGGGDPTSDPAADDDEEEVIYAASFAGMEESFVKYHTAQWVLYSLLLVLAWGIGLFMLLYLPVRRYVLRKEIRSRRLFVTNNSIVYQVVRPVPFPCFGSVADVVIEQGYLQSLFGVYSVRIENVGVRRPPSDDVQIQGVADPTAFRKAVLTRLANIRTEAFARQISSAEDISNLRIPHQQGAWVCDMRLSFFYLELCCFVTNVTNIISIFYLKLLCYWYHISNMGSYFLLDHKAVSIEVWQTGIHASYWRVDIPAKARGGWEFCEASSNPNRGAIFSNLRICSLSFPSWGEPTCETCKISWT